MKHLGKKPPLSNADLERMNHDNGESMCADCPGMAQNANEPAAKEFSASVFPKGLNRLAGK